MDYFWTGNSPEDILRLPGKQQILLEIIFFQFVLRYVKLTLINQADGYNVFPKMLGTVALKTTKITICKHIGCFGQRYCCTHIPE